MTEQQAIGRIASYCSKAERAKSDVYKKLDAWQLDSDAIGRIISLLEKENFLNEERFCQSFIKDKLRFNKWGKAKIVFELKKKQVSDNLINKAFDCLDEECNFETSLLKLLQTKMPQVKAKSEYEKRIKLFRFASGKGYSSDLIKKCLNKITGDFDDADFE